MSRGNHCFHAVGIVSCEQSSCGLSVCFPPVHGVIGCLNVGG